MKQFTLLFMGLSLLFSACCRTPCEVWDDTKSAKRHMSKSFKTLGGKHGNSRQVYCREDFMCTNEGEQFPNEFIALEDDQFGAEIAMADYNRQPKFTPGDQGSGIPGIDYFQDPSVIPEVAGVFRHVHFPYDSNLIKGEENLKLVKGIATYLKKHPDVYAFIEGHCDERGPQAYNLALGTRRANAVRNLLIEQGVNPDHLFTISYGKERPLVFGNNDESFKQNRRAEFKVYRHNGPIQG